MPSCFRHFRDSEFGRKMVPYTYHWSCLDKSYKEVPSIGEEKPKLAYRFHHDNSQTLDRILATWIDQKKSMIIYFYYAFTVLMDMCMCWLNALSPWNAHQFTRFVACILMESVLSLVFIHWLEYENFEIYSMRFLQLSNISSKKLTFDPVIQHHNLVSKRNLLEEVNALPQYISNLPWFLDRCSIGTRWNLCQSCVGPSVSKHS